MQTKHVKTKNTKNDIRINTNKCITFTYIKKLSRNINKRFEDY